jgi:hypothetical protein
LFIGILLGLLVVVVVVAIIVLMGIALYFIKINVRETIRAIVTTPQTIIPVIIAP